MDTSAISPTNIRVDVKSNVVDVTWPDETVSQYTGAYLRFVCPCAGCRGHAPGQVEPPSEAQCAAVRITGAEGVGGYAIRFDFTDGHATGIYSWPLLWRKRPEQPEEAQ